MTHLADLTVVFEDAIIKATDLPFDDSFRMEDLEQLRQFNYKLYHAYMRKHKKAKIANASN